MNKSQFYNNNNSNMIPNPNNNTPSNKDNNIKNGSQMETESNILGRKVNKENLKKIFHRKMQQHD